MSALYTWQTNAADDSRISPLGYQQLTPVSAEHLTVPANSDFALIQANGDDVWFRDDGIAPTVGIGMAIIKNDTIQYIGDLTAIQLISATGKANVSYYAYGAA